MLKAAFPPNPGGAERVPVCSTCEGTPDTALPCLPQASTLYGAGAHVLTQNFCWGQARGHLKRTPRCHTARHAQPRMCLGAASSPTSTAGFTTIPVSQTQGLTKVTEL